MRDNGVQSEAWAPFAEDSIRVPARARSQISLT